MAKKAISDRERAERFARTWNERIAAERADLIQKIQATRPRYSAALLEAGDRTGESLIDLARIECERFSWEDLLTKNREREGKGVKYLKHWNHDTVTVGELIEKLQKFDPRSAVAYTWEGQILPVDLTRIIVETTEQNRKLACDIVLLDAETFLSERA